jgi:2-succinyl-6-hydroxy-2,4-cyclohexadiene-1-carboxylate synthase
MPTGLHVARLGTGPRLVLVHGFTQTGASWSGLAAALAAGYEVVMPDAPGHGGSTGVAAAGIGEAASLLVEAAGTGHYVGYSMGGRVSLQAALDHPQRVRSLTLVSTTAGIEDEAARAARRLADEALADRLEPPGGGAAALGLAEFLDEWLSGPLFSHLTPAQAGVGARLANTSGGLAASLRTVGSGAMAPLWGRLAELAMPVMVVAGAADQRFVQLSARLAGLVDGARLEVVGGAGHAVPFEQPEVFAALLGAFLAGAEQPGR